MKMKRIVAWILCLVLLAATLTACGKKEAPAGGGDAKTEQDSGKDTNKDTGKDDGKTEDKPAPVNLKWYLHGSNVTDDKDVLAAVNEYLTDKINVTIEPIWGTWGDFDNNVVLAINGGDDVDIYFTCSWSANEYNAFAKKGAYLRLDSEDNNLIDKYAKELWDQLPAVLTTGAKINGSEGYGVYAVPGYKDIATQNCWDINVPLLEKYGYTLDDIRNTDYYGFGEILKTVKEGEGDSFYPLLVEGAVLERMVTNSIIVTGDAGTNNMLSYYLDPTDVSKDSPAGNHILSKFETPEYKKFVEKTHEYFEAGYIDPAMANADQANEIRSQKQLTGEYLIGTQSYSLGYEIQASAERKFEVAMVPCTDAYVDTTSSQGAMMAISTTSKHPEEAMQFLNLLNTDPKLMTMLNFGLEGTHYNLNDAGEAVFTAKRDDYSPWTNGMGNVTMLPPLEGAGTDFWDGFKAYYGSAKEIPILGWAFDPKNVEIELGALTNVAAEYALALDTGSVNPDEALPAFIEKLKANGIDKVVAEANAQLDEFMAAKGN